MPHGGWHRSLFCRQLPFGDVDPEEEKEYPEAEMFGILPSYGFFVRHAKNIRFSNVKLQTEVEDLRPAIYLTDVTDADFGSLYLGSTVRNVCNIRTENSQNISIGGSRTVGGSSCFLQLTGKENRKIALFNNMLSNTIQLVEPGVTNKKEISESGNIR